MTAAPANTTQSAPEQAKAGPANGAAPAKKVARRPATVSNGAARGNKGTAGSLVRRKMGRTGDPIGIVLLVRQAARVADRLEALDAVLSGAADAWAVLSLPRTDAKRGRVVIEVQVGELVKEERAQGALFRSIVADIEKYRAGQPPDPPKKGDKDDDDLVD